VLSTPIIKLVSSLCFNPIFMFYLHAPWKIAISFHFSIVFSPPFSDGFYTSFFLTF
jgi:hypothetical protein